MDSLIGVWTTVFDAGENDRIVNLRGRKPK
jgi:hypothetical protein